MGLLYSRIIPSGINCRELRYTPTLPVSSQGMGAVLVLCGCALYKVNPAGTVTCHSLLKQSVTTLRVVGINSEPWGRLLKTSMQLRRITKT